MDDVLLSVRPAACGWSVDTAHGVEPLLFLSGAKAEAQAHLLARCIADVGSDARVLVHDRAQQVVGSTRYFAAERDG